MKGRRRSILLVGVLLLVAVLLSGCCGATSLLTSQRATEAPRVVTREVKVERLVTAVPQPTPVPPAGAVEEVVAGDSVLPAVYELANPAVVNITTLTRLSHLYGYYRPGYEQDQEDTLVPRGEGSGWVYDDQGHIVTNNHVVEGAEQVMVTFWNDVAAVAEVVGTDPDSDLAVIRVDVDGELLHPLTLADSKQLRVGDRVVAIGNPYGLEGTMTTGIVSALGRLMPTAQTADGGRYTLPDIIQTDAAINPGNSGGPLLDLQGNVVGVNTAITSPTGAFSGVGFAVPSSTVAKVVPSLIAQGYYEHPWLGVTTFTLTPAYNEAAGLSADQRGVLVLEVTRGGPADEAGVKPCDETIKYMGSEAPAGGDIIVGIDGRQVDKFDDLISYLSREVEAGQHITLTVLRDGQALDLSVTVGVRPRS
ncbi:MAG: S1C family serine protease [Anaerolineae bacterium]